MGDIAVPVVGFAMPREYFVVVASLKQLLVFLAAHEDDVFPDTDDDWRVSTEASQRGPVPIHALPLDLSHLSFADSEAMSDDHPRLSHGHFVVLSIHEGKEDFPAALLG
jgi:hypothetical protein